jgi:hypothetical protein
VGSPYSCSHLITLLCLVIRSTERVEVDAAAEGRGTPVEEQSTPGAAEQPLGAIGSFAEAADQQQWTDRQAGVEELMDAQQMKARVDAAEARLRDAVSSQQPGAVKAQACPLTAQWPTLHQCRVPFRVALRNAMPTSYWIARGLGHATHECGLMSSPVITCSCFADG